jgi:quercetin dioxygenase-like cupin family protein
MRPVRVITSICAAVLCGFATVPSTPVVQAASQIKTTPLILEKNEGEQRIARPWPGHPELGETIFLKVDPQNGGSSHLVFGTADLAPGKSIETHRHPGADEILFLQTGTARVRLGGAKRDVHGGATVFIPANTWVSVDNIGPDPIALTFVFSAPGFEEFLRATSARAGEKNIPLSQVEEDQIEKNYSHCVIYQ